MSVDKSGNDKKWKVAYPMRNSNVGTMVWKVVLQQFYFEQANANSQHFFHLVGAINDLIDNRSNKSN